MDMNSFNDERDKTETCFKLGCNHAFHTNCIIETLSKSNLGCPSCNSQKTPQAEFTREGLRTQLMKDLKKDEEIKELLKEFKDSSEEYSNSLSQLKKEIREYAKKRQEELCIPEKRKYILECLHTIQTTSKKIARTKGPQYVGMLNTDRPTYWRGTSFEIKFFGATYARTLSRLKYPSLYMTLY